MAYSFDDAITELEKRTSNPSYTKEDLFELAKQVDITAMQIYFNQILAVDKQQ